MKDAYVRRGFVLSAAALVAALTAPAALAQTTFERHYGDRPTSSSVQAVRPTADGGFATLGTTYRHSHGGSDFYFVKTNAAGDTVFTRTYGGPREERGLDLAQTPDGGYALAGTTRSFGAGGQDVYLVKIDPTGTVQWTQTYGGPGYDDCQGLGLLANGTGFVLAGAAAPATANGSPQLFVVRAAATGAAVWSRTYPATSNSYEYAHAVQQTTDGGFVVAGSVDDQTADILLKLDAAGTPQWRQTYSDPTTQGTATSVQQTTDGGYVLAGMDDRIDSTGARITKVSASGVLQFVYQTGNDGLLGLCARQTADGGYALLATTSGFYSFGQLYNYGTPVLLKLTAAGTLQFRQAAGTGADAANGLRELPNGAGFVLAGTAGTPGPISTPGGKALLLRLGTQGTPVWRQEYGVPGLSGPDEAHDVCLAPGGGYVVLSSEYLADGNLATRVTKLDAGGAILWSRHLSSPGGMDAWSVQAVPAGGYIVLATTNDNVGSTLRFVRLDALGATLWTRDYANVYGSPFGAVRPTPDGGFIAASVHNLTTTSTSRAWLLKLNAVGDTTWTRTFGPGTAGYDVTTTTNGDYVLAGRTAVSTRTQAWAVRCSSTGQVLWSRTYGRRYRDRATSVVQTQDGGFVLGGYSYDRTTYLGKGLILKLNAVGDSIWSQLLGSPTDDSRVYRVRQYPSGEYLVSGTNTSNADVFDADILGIRALVLKIPASGVGTIWSRTFGGPVGNTLFYGGEITPDGGFIGAGRAIYDDEDVYVVKADANGLLPVRLGQPVADAATLHPNPTRTGLTRLRLADAATGPLAVSLTDVLGRVVRQWPALLPAATGDYLLNASGLPAGTYLVRVQSPAGAPVNSRLVIE